jgi:uncharacterized protein
MSTLYYTGNFEHSLLALVIREGGNAPKDSTLGRTAIQKIVYFLKALGVPTRYQFEIHHYGPFCDQITSDLELLMADGVIVDKGAAPRYAYTLASVHSADELITTHSELAERYGALVTRVVTVFGGLAPRDLELYATLHYAYRYEMAGDGAAPKERVLARFREYKGEKFTPAELDGAYDAMVAASLISNRSERTH